MSDPTEAAKVVPYTGGPVFYENYELVFADLEDAVEHLRDIDEDPATASLWTVRELKRPEFDVYDTIDGWDMPDSIDDSDDCFTCSVAEREAFNVTVNAWLAKNVVKVYEPVERIDMSGYAKEGGK